MNRIILIALSLSILQAGIAFSQEINTDIVGKKMSFFKKLEAKNKGKVYEADGDILVPGGMAMPIKYRRMQKDIPDLIVNYIFTEKDSAMHEIEYEWDVKNFEDTENNVKPLVFHQALIRKYNKLVSELTAKFGASESKGELTDLAKIENAGGLQRSDRWSTKDNTEIYLYTAMSNYYKSEGEVKRIPTHRIRLYVSHKRK